MHLELVEERDWLTEKQFLNALPFCMMLPGPGAMRYCAYSGWKIRGMAGGLIAGLRLVLPCTTAMMLHAAFCVRLGMLPIAYALYLGVNAIAIIEVAESLGNLSGQSPLSLDRRAVAILSFIAIFAFGLPLPVVFAGAAVYGAVAGAGRRRDLTFLQPPQRAR